MQQDIQFDARTSNPATRDNNGNNDRGIPQEAFAGGQEIASSFGLEQITQKWEDPVRQDSTPTTSTTNTSTSMSLEITANDFRGRPMENSSGQLFGGRSFENLRQSNYSGRTDFMDQMNSNSQLFSDLMFSPQSTTVPMNSDLGQNASSLILDTSRNEMSSDVFNGALRAYSPKDGKEQDQQLRPTYSSHSTGIQGGGTYNDNAFLDNKNSETRNFQDFNDTNLDTILNDYVDSDLVTALSPNLSNYHSNTTMYNGDPRRHSMVVTSDDNVMLASTSRGSISHQFNLRNIAQQGNLPMQGQEHSGATSKTPASPPFSPPNAEVDVNELNNILEDYNFNFTDPFDSNTGNNNNTVSPTDGDVTHTLLDSFKLHNDALMMSPQSSRTNSARRFSVRKVPHRGSVPIFESDFFTKLSQNSINQGSSRAEGIDPAVGPHHNHPGQNCNGSFKIIGWENSTLSEDDHSSINLRRIVSAGGNRQQPHSGLNANGNGPTKFIKPTTILSDNGSAMGKYTSGNGTDTFSTGGGTPDHAKLYNGLYKRSASMTNTPKYRRKSSTAISSFALTPLTDESLGPRSSTPSMPPSGLSNTLRRSDPSTAEDDMEKPFHCEQCLKAFKRSEHLKRHVRSVHSQERPYGCNICDKKFSRSDNLSQHLKTHKRHGDF
ncbi:stress-responsive transcriptional activator MSN2 KNAG_0M02310 [Huiozyma naganishii CBS 8797]|uniref:C2H2-type domain-containing protein n=1 Tax=Huiozyma naganishii (strain ATCC MYA-139 / BCRC 22969 / CBS 8797 / KCTC 17520 / NBRC 10181 / NCYC 3082 / Yp74L-3) TaxID=1071383 RepID=J7SAV4_HUIN7|nr:hypothetical protein KNAG_0M02310 [Kazachstania naganishii CBS 8797]CCK73084.1 hypothetical protein KNAG_0M02310 [Kazachstania naganishii CBS 8797]